MNKFAKNCLILTACLALTACDFSNNGLTHNYFYREICVDGVIYLRSPNGNLTPKINADFYPYQCKTEELNHG